ncbi:hypothetical protein Ddye_005444 [Dipteronia dyeriana]|uniref:Uncharacterized protein n=1 Tax=Dipteronia dyeriana TaxID=168575 RepID=A0AAD9XGU2_9ROSI|nr:hypothetical protein Ddye_005444 [Dipteronia dyeriana]
MFTCVAPYDGIFRRGGAVIIEEETVNKDLLFRGRALVLIPYGLGYLGKIKVVIGRSSFSISVRDDSTLANPYWILRHLGLGKSTVDVQHYLGSDNLNCCDQKKGVGAAVKLASYHSSREKLSGVGEGCQFTEVSGITRGLGFEDEVGIGNLDNFKMASGETNRVHFKGKNVCKGVGVEEIWSSSVEESEEWYFLHSPKFRSETSCGDQLKGGNLVIDLGYGLGQSEGPLSNVLGYSEIQEAQYIGNMSKAQSEGVETLSGHSVTYISETQFRTSDEVDGELVKNSILRSPSLGNWNLEVELAKVIENGVALDVVNCAGSGVEARGAKGGIITLWNEEVFEAGTCISNDRCIIVSGLNKSLSDNNPIMIGEPVDDWGSRPFHFFNGWLDDISLMEGVRKVGEGAMREGIMVQDFIASLGTPSVLLSTIR